VAALGLALRPFGAIAWDVFSWYLGLPTSSSHALVGVTEALQLRQYHGVAGMLIPSGWTKTIAFYLHLTADRDDPRSLHDAGDRLALRYRSPRGVDWIFRRGQLISAALYSLGHGGADAQKTMGIIAIVLVAANLSSTAAKRNSCLGRPQLSRRHGSRNLERWMENCAHHGQAAHQAEARWRLSRLKTAGAATLLMAVFGGIPVSTTHTINGGHRWCWVGEEAPCGALGCGGENCLGLDFHDTGRCSYRLRCLSSWYRHCAPNAQ